MQFSSNNRHRETHRETLERLELHADREFAPASQRAIWNLADRLRAIDEAEHVQARSYMSMDDHFRVSTTLAGQTPDEARDAAHIRYARDYAAAVKAERFHAQLVLQVAA